MCGIAGIVEYKDSRASHADALGRMCSRLEHRGPDDVGVFVSQSSNPFVGLGHRRLSIIDLSPDGQQPMSNERDSIRIVFNGEIYNYPELRIELEKKGHVFKSNTDTETALHLYEEYGEGFVSFLRGMFAFAIWDGEKKMLLMARDRVGKKPLLYFNDNGRFVFASEFASILESGLVEKRMNDRSIDSYLSFGYVPAPETVYDKIFKLPPAHILILKDGAVTIKKYWDLDYSKKIAISEQDAAAETLRILSEAVKIRLHSDVPLGAFLSGGIDSSVVVALMSRESSSRVKTFSIGFEEKSYDELRYARKVADRFNTDHHEFIVKPDAAGVLPLLVERYGEPYADSSCIPTYYVALETRKHVTVALNGDGGDEVFGGYERYQAMIAAEFFRALPGPARGAVKSIAKAIPDSTNSKNMARRLRRFFDGADLPFAERYLRWVNIFSDGMKANLYSDDFKGISVKGGALNYLGALSADEHTDLLDRLLKIDVKSYLPNDLLVKVDIASMANSLEARSPFLDHKVMEFAASLPADYKIRGFQKKYILRKAIKDIVPSKNINRRKMGFGAPVGSWIRSELKDLVTESVFSRGSLSSRYFKRHALEEMISRHMGGKVDHTFQVWAILMLELWHARFMK